MLVFAATGMMFIMDFMEPCWSTALHICSFIYIHVFVTCFIIKWHCEVGLKLLFKNPCFRYSIILKLPSLLNLAELNRVNVFFFFNQNHVINETTSLTDSSWIGLYNLNNVW
jgi:hypothetical protein